jgi:hypothetical protein
MCFRPATEWVLGVFIPTKLALEIAGQQESGGSSSIMRDPTGNFQL